MEAQTFFRDSQLPEVLTGILGQQPDGHIFVLVDGTTDSPLLERFFRYAPDADYHPLFLGTDMEDCLPYSPYMAQISLRHMEFIQTCTWECSPIWFTSPIPMERQLDFWKSRLYTGLPDGRHLLFRYWNPKILGPFVQDTDPTVAQSFLRPVVNLITPHPIQRQFAYHTIQPSIEVRAIPGSWPFPESALKVFEQSFSQLQSREIENHLWANAPEIMEQVHPALVPIKINAGLECGLKLGLSRDDALCRFVECQMRWGDGFWQHEAFQSIWQQPDPGELFLAKLEIL